jgi:hypothetical protein
MAAVPRSQAAFLPFRRSRAVIDKSRGTSRRDTRYGVAGVWVKGRRPALALRLGNVVTALASLSGLAVLGGGWRLRPWGILGLGR